MLNIFHITPYEFAPEWLQIIAKSFIKNPKAVAVIRMYDRYEDSDKHPNLRDRSDEVEKMLKGLAEDLNEAVFSEYYKGTELHEFGAPIVGAAFAATFKVFVI